MPNEVARLVNDLIQVVSCTLDGALQGQEELERQQHAIWRQEDLHLADLAEKKKDRERKRYERLHSPSEDANRRKYLIARVNETTGGKRRTKRNTQSKQVQKLQAFVFPGSDSQFRVKRPSTTNAKSSYEKLLEYCAQQNQSQTPISYDQQKTTNTGIMEIRDTNTRSRGDTRGMFLAFPKTKSSLESKQNPFVRFQSGGNDKLIYSQVGEIMQRDRSVIPPEEEREMHPSEKHVLNDWEKMLTASSYIVKPDSSDTACNKMRKMPNLVDGNVSSNASKLQCTHTPSASLIQELLFPQTTRVIHRCNECSIVIPFRSTQYAVYSQQSRGPRNEMLCDRCNFSMKANKRQKEVNAHVSKLKPTHKKPKSHILCSKEGKTD